MDASDLSQDPGCGKLGPRLLFGLIPGYVMLNRRGGVFAGGDGLIVLRQLWMSFVNIMAILLFGVVVVLVVPGSAESPAALWVAAIIAAGSLALATSSAFGRRPLDCAGKAQLAASYRARFFLRIAFAEAVALFAFVASFLTGQWWIYWIGAGFTLAGFAANAPTRDHLAADQRVLSASGCLHSLTAALRTPPKDG